MWGNSTGWLISAALVALCAGWLYYIANASTPTPPTEFSVDARNFTPIRVPQPPAEALPPEPAGKGDAGEIYRRAIALCLAERPSYEDFTRMGKLDSPAAAKLQAVDLLIEAARTAGGEIFHSQPTEIVNYNRSKPPLEALQVLGRVCIDRLGLLHARAGKIDDAMNYYRAGMSLGWRLTQERLAYDELALGLELMSKSSAGMAAITPPEVAEALRGFDRRRIDYVRRHVDPLLRITRAIDAKIVGTHTGDVFELARRSNARMWRVEAILALGRVKFFAGAGGTRANVNNAMKLLRELAEDDPDPIIRTAAAAARDLTIEQHRMQ